MLYDTLIIGGGIAGLSAAFYLTQMGEKIAIVDKGEIGRGTTWAAAGMLAPVNELEFHETDVLKLGVESQKLYNDWIGIIPNFPVDKTGTIEVALTPDDLPYLERQFEFQQANGQQVKWLSGAEIRALEPLVHPEIQAGILAKTDIQIDQRKLIPLLIRFLTKANCDIFEGACINSIENEADGSLTAKDFCRTFAARKVLATVGFSSEQPLNLPFKLYPVKGQMISVEPPQVSIRHTLRIRSRAYGNAYIVPKANRLILGSTQEEMGADTRQTVGGLIAILQKCYTVLPAIYDQPVIETWSGLRPATLDRKPIFYREPERPVYHLNGLYRHGILLAPLLGQSAAQWLVSGAIPPIVEPYLHS